jgi:hypothetical protein
LLLTVTVLQMYILQYEPRQNQNDLQLCRACYERGAPPPGSANRPWVQEFELTVVDLSHPHVVLGPQLVEVADYHVSAHRKVAQQMAKELQAWGFDLSDYDDPSDALIAMMRRFRSGKPAIRQMVQHRVQHVATGPEMLVSRVPSIETCLHLNSPDEEGGGGEGNRETMQDLD